MISASKRYDTAFTTRKVFGYGLISMIPYYLIWPEWPEWRVITQPEVLTNLLFLGCVASMLCFVVWNWVLKKIGAVTTTNYAYFNPVMTMAFAWALLSERITIYFIAGTVLILVGMYLINRQTEELAIERPQR